MGLDPDRAMSSPNVAHFGPVGHVSVSSENPGLVSAYTKVSLGTAPRPRWVGRLQLPRNPTGIQPEDREQA